MRGTCGVVCMKPGSPQDTPSWWKVPEPGHKATGRERCKAPRSCLLEAEHGKEQYVTADNGKAGKCDQKPGLQLTGKTILVEKEILFKKPKNKDI